MYILRGKNQRMWIFMSVFSLSPTAALIVSSFEHGSEEADRRVKELGYCRIHMPSVPRTGSTWFRAMFEVATSQSTFSMWKGELSGHRAKGGVGIGDDRRT